MTTGIPKTHCATCGGKLREDGACLRCMFSTVMGTDDDFAEELPPPAVLGDYELIEEIARGGMGVVWRARQRRLNRMVALKLLRESSLPGEAVARRFRIEAEAAAQLRHPHIVDVHEVGEIGGRWFLSMELLAGTLAGRGAMPARAAAELMAKIARAVQHAHDRGILHRDLKPANVLLDEAGEPRVGDFGLARFAEKDSTLTQSGAVIGTPAYMSPEQAAGRELTTASDIYSLGAIFYELLAGRPPFEGSSMVEVIRKVCDEEPKPLRGMSKVQSPRSKVQGDAWDVECPRDLEAIVFKCLEKNPAARYASALALADDTERWLRGEPIRARRATSAERLWKWARRHPAWAALWTVVALGLVVILVGGAVFNRHLVQQRQKAEAATEATLHTLARQHAQSALHFTETGDWHRGLLSLAEAVEIGSGDAAADRLNRLRFESIVRLGPRLEALWFPRTGERLHAQFAVDEKSVLRVQGRSARLGDGPALEHAAEIVGAEVSADGSRVVCGTSDGRWTLWDPRAGKMMADGEGRVRDFPKDPVSRPRGTFGGQRFVVVQGDRIVRQFRAEDGQSAVGDISHERPVLWAALAPDAEKLFTLTDDGLLRLFAGDDVAQMSRPRQLDPQALPQAFFNGPLSIDRLITILNGDEKFMILGWKHDRRATVAADAGPHSFVSPDPIVAMGWQQQRYCIYVVATNEGAMIRSPWQANDTMALPMGTRVSSADLDDFGNRAVTLAVNGAAQRWALTANRARTSGPRVWSIGKPLEVRLSPDGQAAAVITSEAGWLWKWPAQDGAHVEINAHGTVSAVAFSADGATLHVALADQPPQVWSVGTGERILGAADDGKGQGAGSKEQGAEGKGRLRAEVGEDQTVRIVEARTGRAVTPPIMHPAPVERARFSPDGRLLCTMWGGQFARVWDAATGEPVTPVFVHPGCSDVVWSANGEWLATFGKGPEVRVWDFSVPARDKAEMKNLARLLSAHRLVPGSDHGLMALTVAELRAAWEEAGKAAKE